LNREQIAQQIVDWEARRDTAGHIRLYALPKNDGGGKWEYAGLNDRYHPQVLRRIVEMVKAGKHADAESMAVGYIASYTDRAGSWAGNWRTEIFLRDSAFNRGPGGAAKILQRALGVQRDGKVGSVTIAALRDAEKDTPALIRKLRSAREDYERAIAGYRANLWRGLVNRWDNVTAAALA